MAFPQGGYPGPFPQQDSGYGMLYYPPGVPTQGPLAYQPQAYHDAAMDAEQGYWQAPHAPRLTAAAARAGRLAPLAHGAFAYPHIAGQTPWHPQMAPFPHQYVQHQQHQPRTHQQLEHQLLMQHQMGKGSQRSSVLPQQAPASQHQGQYNQRRQASLHPQPSRTHPDEQGCYASHPSSYSYHRGRSQTHRDSWNGTSQAQEYDVPQRTSLQATRDWREADSTWSNWQQQTHRNSVPQLAYPHQYHQPQQYFDPRDSWANGEQAHLPEQWHGFSQPHLQSQGYPAVNDSQANAFSAYSAQQAADAQARQQADMWSLQQRHQLENSLHLSRGSHTGAQGSPPRSSPDLWQPRPETRRPDLQQDAEVVKAPAGKTEGLAADNGNQEPAPPSPDTLDNSAVPIAAIGAQLIWTACTALFAPDLLADAHDALAQENDMDEDADQHFSPTQVSVPSSSSTPPINTPDISPWASTVLDSSMNTNKDGDWNSFRSPFGPNAESDTSKPSRGRGRVGSDATFSNHLHRMAVGAERVGRSSSDHQASPARSRQTSGAHSDFATAHSSGTSTASSSEPGTPISVRDGSPTLSSTISAHSSDASRSFRDGSAMSIDRSPSKAAIVSPKSSSKSPGSTASSRWSGRMRDNVLAVLRLVSPDWKFSNNDHQLVSLTLPPSVTATPTDTTSSKARSGRACGGDSVTSIVTSYANEPSPAFRRFAHQVLAQTLLSPTAFLLGILNALRLPLMARLPDGSIDPTVLDLFAQPTSAAPFKLLTLGLMIANKHLDDNTFLNKTWNEVTGIPLPELNQIEAWFLKKCNYDITVPDETWASFLHKVQSWEEKRSSYGVHRDQDCSKRLLVVLDEAVSHFDVIPNFRLDNSQQKVTESVVSDSESPMAAMRRKLSSVDDSWGRPNRTRSTVAALSARSTPAIGSLLSENRSVFGDDHSPRRSADMTHTSSLDNTSTLLRSRSDFATSSSSKTMSPMSDSGKSQVGTMSGPLMPSTLLNGSRALLHGSSFAPLATPT